MAELGNTLLAPDDNMRIGSGAATLELGEGLEEDK